MWHALVELVLKWYICHVSLVFLLPEPPSAGRRADEQSNPPRKPCGGHRVYNVMMSDVSSPERRLPNRRCQRPQGFPDSHPSPSRYYRNTFSTTTSKISA